MNSPLTQSDNSSCGSKSTSKSCFNAKWKSCFGATQVEMHDFSRMGLSSFPDATDLFFGCIVGVQPTTSATTTTTTTTDVGNLVTERRLASADHMTASRQLMTGSLEERWREERVWLRGLTCLLCQREREPGKLQSHEKIQSKRERERGKPWELKDLEDRGRQAWKT